MLLTVLCPQEDSSFGRETNVPDNVPGCIKDTGSEWLPWGLWGKTCPQMKPSPCFQGKGLVLNWNSTCLLVLARCSWSMFHTHADLRVIPCTFPRIAGPAVPRKVQCPYQLTQRGRQQISLSLEHYDRMFHLQICTCHSAELERVWPICPQRGTGSIPDLSLRHQRVGADLMFHIYHCQMFHLYLEMPDCSGNPQTTLGHVRAYFLKHFNGFHPLMEHFSSFSL